MSKEEQMRVKVITDRMVFRGTLHVPEGLRFTDAVERLEKQIALCDVEVRSVDDDSLIMKSPFLVVRLNQVIALVPFEDEEE